MNGNLAQFGEDLRQHLLRLQTSLDNINGLFSGMSDPGRPEFVARLEELQAMARASQVRTTELRAILDIGLDGNAAPESVARWIAQRQTAQLHALADSIEQQAVAAIELVTLSAIEAERVAMTAILARQQAVALQVERGGPL